MLGRVEESHHILMSDHHPFRGSRRAGRVDDIGRAVQLQREGKVFRRFTRQKRSVPVQIQHRRLTVRQPASDLLLGHDDDRIGIPKHEPDPVGRIDQIHGHIRPARFQHGQDRRHHIGAPIQVEGDETFPPYAQSLQVMRQPIRASIELSIGALLLSAAHGDLARSAPGLEFKPMVEKRPPTIDTDRSRIPPATNLHI